MAHQVGIGHHYPPLTKFEYVILIGIPAGTAISKGFGVIALSSIGTWIAVILGCLLAGWVLEVLKCLMRAVERHGYKTAVDDLRLLCVGDAKFHDGDPDDPRNLIAAAIVTLELGTAR